MDVVHKFEIVKAEASWCGGCKAVAPMLKRMSEELGIVIKSVDVEENFEYAKDVLKVKNLPSIVVFENGVEVGRLTGKKTKEEYYEFLKNYN